jgi:hypothetical protein
LRPPSIRDLAYRWSLEQLGGSPQAASKRHPNTNVATTPRGDRPAPSVVSGVGPFCVEPDEQRAQPCRIHHFGSPSSTVCDLDTTFPRDRPGVQHLSISDYY